MYNTWYWVSPFSSVMFGPDGGAGTGGSEGTGATGGSEGAGGAEGTKAKTFTQEDVNRMMAREKQQGRLAVLKDLGIEGEDETGLAGAKESLQKHKASMEAQKTEAEKAKELATAEQARASAAEQKSQLLQHKLDAITSGVKPDCVDDTLALAMPRITNDKDLAKVLTELKERYPMFFTDTQETKPGQRGTGTHFNSKRTTSGAQDKTMGERLGEQAKPSAKKSTYFK